MEKFTFRVRRRLFFTHFMTVLSQIPSTDIERIDLQPLRDYGRQTTERRFTRVTRVRFQRVKTA